jgi:hypothetical protein
VVVRRTASSAFVTDSGVVLTVNDLAVGGFKQKGPFNALGLEDITYGGASDLWGSNLLRTDLPLLGVTIRARFSGPSGEGSALVDAVSMRLHFCTP